MSLDLTLKNLEFRLKVADSPKNRVFEFEDFRLDTATKLLYRGGDQVVLTPKAVETLIALVESEGQVVGKDELMRKIWADAIVEESNLAQYLHILRKTLGQTSDGRAYIETLKRRGYRFNGAVRVSNIDQEGSSGAALAPEPATGVLSIPPSLPHRTDRHGQVRALRPVAAQPESAPPLSVERSDNLYSISSWRRESVSETAAATETATRSKWFFPLVAVLMMAGLAAIGFGIYRFATRNRGVETRQVPFSESDLRRLTTSGRSEHAAISPDGKYVAHVMVDAEGDSLWVRQVAVANDTRLAGPSPNDFVWVTFAPDGNFVYYLALAKDKGETELFRVPVLGGPIVKVMTDIAPPTFSPDGTRVAFMRTNQEETQLLVANADGTNEAILLTRHAPDYLNMFWYAPAWSLDGKSIAVPVNHRDERGRYETVLAVDVATRAERKLTEMRWQQVGQPRWLADGLVVTASESSTAPQQLWHISLTDGTASRITRDLNNYENLSLTADAKTLAVIQDHVVSNIWTLGGEAAAARQIISEAGWLNELIWLPDGRLAYTSSAGGTSEIWTMNADGSGIRQLTVNANARLGLAVTADKKQLVFAAEREGRYNLWRVEIDGSKLTQITSGDGEFYPQCTPDGRWIVYQSGGNYPTLWKMPIAGGTSTALTKTTASRPSISPDGKLVAYHYLDSSREGSQWAIGVISLDDGKKMKSFDFPPTVVERLVKWTPDGKSIAFLNSPGGVPNVWTQPLEGGAPQPLTTFQSDSIITFNWSADGGKLAVIRGVKTSDVLLLNRAK